MWFHKACHFAFPFIICFVVCKIIYCAQKQNNIYLTVLALSSTYYFCFLTKDLHSSSFFVFSFFWLYLWLMFNTKLTNNVFNVDNIAYTWALISEWMSGLRISGSILQGWPLLGGRIKQVHVKKTQHESCSKAQTSSDWINIYWPLKLLFFPVRLLFFPSAFLLPDKDSNLIAVAVPPTDHQCANKSLPNRRFIKN